MSVQSVEPARSRPYLSFLGNRVRIVAGGEPTAPVGLVEMTAMPPGDMPPLHVHHDEDEGFYVLDGEITLYMPGDQVTLRPGDFRLSPRGVPHTYRVGDTPARVLVTSLPGGFERFVEDVAALKDPTPETLTAVAATHDIEILGPPGMLP